MDDVQKRAVAPKKIDSRGLRPFSSHCKDPHEPLRENMLVSIFRNFI